MSEQASPIDAVIELAVALDVADINKLPGCWEHRIDDRWWLAMNGHPQDARCSHGADVPPYCVYVEYNGWPAGIFHATGEGSFAAGVGANPETFAAAIRAVIAERIA